MGNLSHDEKMVGVIFGFIKQLISLANTFNSNKFVFCWDSKQSYRSLIYPEYKNNRAKAKDMEPQKRQDLSLAYGQFDLLRNSVLSEMGFSNIFHQTGYEADDLISWIAMRIPDNTIIVSADNDLYQLLKNDRYCPVKIWNCKSINDEQRFKTDWFGLNPRQWIEIKSIAGCNSDNISGAYGIGEISAARFLVDQLKGEKQKKIQEWVKGEKMIINRRLITLPFPGKKQIDIKCTEEDKISPSAFKEVFSKYGFRSLLKEEEISKWHKAFFPMKGNGGK